MAVVENARYNNVSLKLNAGNHLVTGRMIVKSCSLGKMVPDADKEKIMAVAELASAVTKYPTVRVERAVIFSLEKV